MAKEFSPEERLLRLIRSTAQKQVAPQQDAKGPPQENAKAAMPAMSSAASAPKGKEGRKKRIPEGTGNILNLENLNLVLVFLLLGLLMIFIPSSLKRQKTAIELLEEKIRPQAHTAPEGKEEKRPPFEYFSRDIGSRNIFQPAPQEEAAAGPRLEEGPKLEEVMGQFALLGVIWGQRPQAIIEDKKAQKTYFLNKGEVFGNIEVRDILENKVILNYKNQQFELVL